MAGKPVIYVSVATKGRLLKLMWDLAKVENKQMVTYEEAIQWLLDQAGRVSSGNSGNGGGGVIEPPSHV